MPADFCRNLCFVCPACMAAADAMRREEAAYAAAAALDARNPGSGRVDRDDLTRAALDHRGRP